jgi:hypothetical protein
MSGPDVVLLNGVGDGGFGPLRWAGESPNRPSFPIFPFRLTLLSTPTVNTSHCPLSSSSSDLLN